MKTQTSIGTSMPLYGEGCIVCQLTNGSIMVFNENTNLDAMRGYEFSSCHIFETVTPEMRMLADIQTRRARYEH